jgi:outer membrane lipoprotein SlyB
VINVRDSAIVRLVARDRFGNVLRHGGREVTFARFGGVGVSVGRIGPVTDHEAGTYTAQYHGDSAGTADLIRSTIDGQPITSASPSVTVGPACTPGPVSLAVSDVTINDTTLARRPVKTLTLPSGVTTTMTLRITDSFGCPVPEPHSVVFATAGGSSTGILGATVALGHGIFTATFTGHTSGSVTQIAVTVDGTPVTSAPVEVTVVPGDISTRTSLMTTSEATVAPGSSITLTLHGRDAAGNKLLQGGRSVTFITVGNDPKGTLTAAIDNGDGTYTASYVGGQAGTDTIVALIEGTRVMQAVTVLVQGQ